MPRSSSPKGHRKVQCWIFSRDAVGNDWCLLLRTIESRGGFWQPVTGSVEDSEDFFTAACRESFEETGFLFAEPPKDTGYEFQFTSRFGPTIERCFVMEIDSMPTPKLDSREHESFQWTTPQKALDLLRFPSNVDGLRRSYFVIREKNLA